MLEDDDLIVGTKSVIRPVWRWVFLGLFIGALLGGVGGFTLFAAHIATAPPPTAQLDRADGIVVLTGRQGEIERSFELLIDDRASRLLLSGVGVCITKEGIRHIVGGDATDAAVERFNCCVDVDREAHDIPGHINATGLWIADKGYERVIIVAAAHHMPRTIMQFRAALPATEITPYPVASGAVPAHEWWLHPRTTLILATEFAKTLGTWLNIQQRIILGSALGD